MPANTTAIYSRLADIQWIQTGVIASSAANNSSGINAGTSFLVFTADATFGGRVEKLVIMPNGNTTNIANVMRIHINNGSSTTTAANNTQFRDISLPATVSTVAAAIGTIEVPMNVALPAGYAIYATVGTSAAAGFNIVAVGGKY
jgi:hypothetical protein